MARKTAYSKRQIKGFAVVQGELMRAVGRAKADLGNRRSI